MLEEAAVGLPELYGGHPVLDFVNTVSWRSDPGRRRERVPDLPTPLAWAREAGVLDGQAASAIGARTGARKAVAAGHRLRGAGHPRLSAPVEAGVPPSAR